MQSQHLLLGEAAKILLISKTTLRRWIKENQFPAITNSYGWYLIDPDDIRKYAKAKSKSISA